MAKAAARAKKAPARRPWSKEDIRLLKSAGPQRARRENRESSQANRRRNASKGEERTHLTQHDPQEASTRKEALRPPAMFPARSSRWTAPGPMRSSGRTSPPAQNAKRKASPSCMGRATVVNGRISCFAWLETERAAPSARRSALRLDETQLSIAHQCLFRSRGEIPHLFQQCGYEALNLTIAGTGQHCDGSALR